MINRWMIKDFTGARATVNYLRPGMSVSRGETCRSERVQGAERPASCQTGANRTAWYTGWYRTGPVPALMSGMSMASLLVCLTILTSRGRWNTRTRTQACAHVLYCAREIHPGASMYARHVRFARLHASGHVRPGMSDLSAHLSLDRSCEQGRTPWIVGVDDCPHLRFLAPSTPWPCISQAYGPFCLAYAWLWPLLHMFTSSCPCHVQMSACPDIHNPRKPGQTGHPE